MWKVVCHCRCNLYSHENERLVGPFRITCFQAYLVIRTCTKTGKFVSSSKLQFSNFTYSAGLHSLLIRVTMETETHGPKSTCCGTTHAENTFLHIKINCCMELVEFFVLALRVYFYKNMKWYCITWPKPAFFFPVRERKRKCFIKKMLERVE